MGGVGCVDEALGGVYLDLGVESTGDLLGGWGGSEGGREGGRGKQERPKQAAATY